MPKQKNQSTPRSRRLAIAAALMLVPAGFASAIEPINTLGRFFGAGWSDGYHACKDSGCRPLADLPPASYPHNRNAKYGVKQASANRHGRLGSFYDAFDAKHGRSNGDCASGSCDVMNSSSQCDGINCAAGCDGVSCDAGVYATSSQPFQSLPPAAFNTTKAEPCQECPQYEQGPTPAKPQLGAPTSHGSETDEMPESPGPYDVRMRRQTEAYLTSDQVEAERRPVRPLPQQQRRRIQIAEPESDFRVARPEYAIRESEGQIARPSSVEIPPPMSMEEYYGSNSKGFTLPASPTEKLKKIFSKPADSFIRQP